MGLLSDPEAGPSKWANILGNYHKPFCFLMCVIAFVWLCILAHRPFNNGNSFSENALLPGLVRSEFVDDGTARRYLHDFQEELKDNYATRDTMPVPWLAAKMRQLNLDVYTHNFTLNFPLGKKQKFFGENVYGILRAGRSASTEALVISVPFRPMSSHHKSTNAGIALMLAMAKFARSRKYWAKDLIFLVTAHEQLGAQAWLQAYHDTGGPSSYWLDAGQLKGRAGAIQAAINLEMSALRFNYMEIKIEGLNGQLPNLDLVTLVHKMCVQAGVHHSYKYSHSWTLRFDQWDNYISSVKTLLAMVATQVTGVPTGNHGLFHRYGIEAVTLMAVGENGGHGRPAHTLEAALRSLNNLLERFHQSYFFYLRTGIDRFLSISQYMPPLGLLCAATFIRAFAMWLVSQKHKAKPKEDGKGDESTSKGEDKDSDNSEDVTEATENKDRGDKCPVVEAKQLENSMNHLDLLNVLIVFLFVHVVGYVVMSSPQLISEIGVNWLKLPTEESIFYGLAIISVLLTVALPSVLRRILQSGDENSPVKRSTAKPLLIMALLEIGTMMLCVGMHNFSLGFCLGCLYSPVVLLINSGDHKQSRLFLWFSKFVWILVHPFMVILITVYLYTSITFPDEKISVLMSRGFTASQQAIMFSIVDGMIYGNWLFNVVTLILLPTWLLFWQILNF